ncbi:MAG TPA: MSMEG_1061 family FMN-dependent PPOX-type flavoprotein [Ilumatobacteraceae bacterium]|nr:MSMEG_1061 family FMN-dependent PPOX-type flavoprotein [Ilumatobacteraceae bacterium]
MGIGEGLNEQSGGADAPVGSIIASLDELASLYRSPNRLVLAKKAGVIDDASAGILARSPFVLLATAGADDGLDVSPRGGPPGFVRVLDEHHVALPDLNGNNLIDSVRAVVATGRAAILVVVPGMDETLRINGRAWVTTDASVLDLWIDELRRPTTAIVVRADEVFMHCAKAFRRGRVWDPTSWDDLADAPDGLDVLNAQGLVSANDAATRSYLEQSYADDLAHDAPER